MSADELDTALQISHLPAMGRLRALMSRVNVADLTPLEVLAMLAVLEAVDARVNGPTATVLRFAPTIPSGRYDRRLEILCGTNIEVIEGELRPVLCTWRVARHPSGKSQSRLTQQILEPAVETAISETNF
jgi:hypothetical protein